MSHNLEGMNPEVGDIALGGGPPSDTAGPDLTGRDRMTRNILCSWSGHLVFIVAGFVMPRMIDRHLGQTVLGVWDFCWSVVGSFNMAQLGIGSSINRYVAKHRAVHDVDGFRRAVSSVLCVQVIAGLIVMLLTGAAAQLVPWLFRGQLGPEGHTASSVVALLGASLAIQTAFNTFAGVITGCHRWDLHNAISAGFYAASVAAMLIALSLGKGLPSLALVYLCGVAAAEVTRAVVAHRICPELRIGLRYAAWSQARRMLLFGSKTFINDLSALLLVQGNVMLVAGYLGSGALALYSRARALPIHAGTLVSKFAFVLTPTASSLQERGQLAELREFLIQSTRFGTFLVLPMTLGLAILGGPILRLWMGPQYEHGLLMAILAVGCFLPMTQQPGMSILMGMNLHGRVGLVSLVAALCGNGLGVITVGVLGWSLPGAALAVVLPLTLGDGIFVPIYACRQLGIPLTQYLRQAFLGPFLCAVPFALCLAASRLLFGDRPLIALGLACAAGVLVLGPLYLRYMLPGRVRRKILGLVVPVPGSTSA